MKKKQIKLASLKSYQWLSKHTDVLWQNLFGQFLGVRRDWILRTTLLNYKNNLKSKKSKILEKISFRLWNLFSIVPRGPLSIEALKAGLKTCLTTEALENTWSKNKFVF